MNEKDERFETVRALVSALERTEANFKRAVNNQAIRDMAETLGENAHALKLARNFLQRTENP